MLSFLLSLNCRLLRRRRRGNLMPPGAHQRRKCFRGRVDFLDLVALWRFHENPVCHFLPFSENYGL